MILAIYIGISYMQGKRTSIRKYVFLLLGFIVFFMGIGIFWGKSGDKKSSLGENIRVSTEVTATYLVLSLNALDNETTHYQEINYSGDNTLRFFVKIAQQINLLPNKKVTNLVKEFLFIPYGTNVYTFYSDYIKDFGKLYAWLMIMLFGALHTWLHNKSLQIKSFRFAVYYSFCFILY
jgi:oligosaccharide repeat unit polymerase